MCMLFGAEEHCSRWDLLLGTGVSELHGKICLKLVHWRHVHLTNTRIILCCEKCEVIWKVKERKRFT